MIAWIAGVAFEIQNAARDRDRACDGQWRDRDRLLEEEPVVWLSTVRLRMVMTWLVAQVPGSISAMLRCRYASVQAR